MSALEKQTTTKVTPNKNKNDVERSIKISTKVMEHYENGCHHCINLLTKILNPSCDKCGKVSERLEKVNPHSDFVYCESCLEVEI